MVYSHNEILYTKKRKCTTWNNTDDCHKVELTKPNTKASMFYNSIYIQFIRRGKKTLWCRKACCQAKSWPSLCAEAKWKIWRQSLEEIERWLLFSASREGNTVGSCLKNCAPCPLHEESRGLYKARAPSQESVLRNKGGRILISSTFIVSKTVIDFHQ